MLVIQPLLVYTLPMRNTCTFPGYKYRVVGQNEHVREGDKINHRNPKYESLDYWHAITKVSIFIKVKDVIPPHYVVIRPL